MPKRPPSRGVIFAAILVTLLGASAVYVGIAALRDDAGGAGGLDGSAGLRDKPHVVFQNVSGRPGSGTYARVALAPADEPGRTRKISRLLCERVYFAADRGLCLLSRQGVFQTGYDVKITGPDFKPTRKLSLTGIPSRARISPDGRYGAVTGFVSGHSYADDSFSTSTVLIDMARGQVVADLEKDFTITRDGKRIKEIDFNFWGVTFARQGGRFYATLRTGEQTYLLEGDVDARQARVIHENVECPSISPDGTRLAYKKWLGDRWRLHVLDLETMQETPLAEKWPVDDQVEWLDDDRILYGRSNDVWVVPADGRGAPKQFLSKALSPAVIRS
jgi:hypothetical protein